MENGNFTGILFLDFQKAFDVVNYKILLTKLKYYKCDDLTISWVVIHNEVKIVCERTPLT
jgi:hypothetical protein